MLVLRVGFACRSLDLPACLLAVCLCLAYAACVHKDENRAETMQKPRCDNDLAP